MSKRILITGNAKTSELVNALQSQYHCDSLSRTNGFDLLTEQGRKAACEYSLNYDVVINSARLRDYGQSQLLRTLHEYWSKRNKSGLILNIGSVADFRRYGPLESRVFLEYCVEKQALHDLSKTLSLVDPQIRVCYLGLGPISSESAKKTFRKTMDFAKLFSVLDFILDQPMDFVIHELSCEVFPRDQKVIQENYQE